jgi:protein-tyrosine phosphatase
MKVLMVCLGNICRSPLAQGILEKKVAQEGLNVEVDSAATSDYHIGHEPDSRSISKAAEYGIDITRQRGRQLQNSDFQEFDRIFVMDTSNYSNTIALTKQEDEIKKVEIILNLINPGSNQSVPDPYFGGEEGFENVYRLLDAACDKIIKQIQNEQS